MDFEDTIKGIGFTDDQMKRLNALIAENDYIRSVFDGVRSAQVKPTEAFLRVIETVAGYTGQFNGVRG